jgi:hypothetical protein
MSQYFDTPTRPDIAVGTIAQHLRVKTTGAVIMAGAADKELGTMDRPCTGSGPCTIRLRTAGGTCKMVASVAIALNGAVWAASGGKVAATGTVEIGIALEAATADGDVIEVLRL